MRSRVSDAALSAAAACHRRRRNHFFSSSLSSPARRSMLALFAFFFALSPRTHSVLATWKEPYKNMKSGAHGLLNSTTYTKAEQTAKFAADTGASDASAWGWVQCYTDAILLPSTTAEAAAGIAGVVASAVAATGAPPKIRATSSVFHSTTPLVCPRAYGGSLGSPIPYNYGPLPPPPTTSAVAPTSVALLLDNLRGVVDVNGGGGSGGGGGGGVDAAARTMTVLAGSRMWQVWKWAAENDLSPPRGVPTAWADLSVGGVASSAAQGVGGASVASGLNDIVLEYTWVDAAGNVHRSLRDSPEGQALAGGVGILGVITEVKLQFEPLSETIAVTLTARSDEKIAEDLEELQRAVGQAAANVALLWLPEVGKYNAFVLADAGNATFLSRLTTLALSSSSSSSSSSSNTSSSSSSSSTIVAALASALAGTLEAKTVGPSITGPIPPGVPQVAAELVRVLQQDANDTSVIAGSSPLSFGGAASCAADAAGLYLEQWAAAAFGSLPVPVGKGVTNYMVANAAPPESVPWQTFADGDGLAVDSSALAFSQDNFTQWVSDVKRIIRLDLGGGPAPQKRRCAPLSTLLLRFGRETPNADVAMTAAGLRRPVLTAYNLLRSRKLPGVPAKYSWVQEAVEQLTLCKYSGRPHWGINFLRTFTNPSCPVRDLYPRFDQLLRQQAAHDPNKVFEPPTFSAIVARSGPLTTAPLCALRKICYCTRDDQCASGWVCRPSRAFPEYNLCVPAGWKMTKK